MLQQFLWSVTICNTTVTVLQHKSEIFCSKLHKYVLQNISQVCSTTRNALQACNIATFRKITFSALFATLSLPLKIAFFATFLIIFCLQTTTLIGLLKTARLLRLVRVARKIGRIDGDGDGGVVRLCLIPISNVLTSLLQTDISQYPNIF